MNVFGNELIHLTAKDLAESDFSPFVMKLCHSLALKPYSVDQLVGVYGESQRDEILVSLKHLNNHGLLMFRESLDSRDGALPSAKLFMN